METKTAASTRSPSERFMNLGQRRSRYRAFVLVLVLLASPVSLYADGSNGLDLVRSLLGAHGNKVVLTHAAVVKGQRIGLKKLLADESVSTRYYGWTLVHLAGESTGIIERRAQMNAQAWKRVSERPIPRSIALAWDRATPDAVATALFHLCGVKIKLNLSAPAPVTLVVINATPVKELCQDFAFVLAANDIVLRNDNGNLVGSFSEVTTTKRRIDGDENRGFNTIAVRL